MKQKEIEGIDLYNQTTTGGVAKTLTAIRGGDAYHVPVVLIRYEREERETYSGA